MDLCAFMRNYKVHAIDGMYIQIEIFIVVGKISTNYSFPVFVNKNAQKFAV